MLSRQNAEQSERVYKIDFLAMLHEVTICSSPQKKMVTSDEREEE